MKPKEVLEYIWSALSIVKFISIKAILYIIEPIVYKINGVYDHKKAIRNGTTEFLAEVHHIVSKVPVDMMSVTTPLYYVLWHEKFVKLEDLIKPSISLYFITGDMAYFVDCMDYKEVYNTKKYPFSVLGQFELSYKMITVSKSALIKLGEVIGDPKCTPGWIFHTARCGSTALSQALNAVPEVIMISEPTHLELYLAEIAGSSEPDWITYTRSQEFKDLCKAGIRFLLKDYSATDIVCIKSRGTFEHQAVLPVVAENYSHHPVLAMYRDAKSIANSLYKTFDFSLTTYYMSLLRLVDALGISHPYTEGIRHSISNGMLPYVDQTQEMVRCQYDVFYHSFMFAVTDLRAMRENLCKVKHLKTILFEDFIADKKGNLLRVFEYFGVPLERVHLALEAIQTDSQKNSPFAKEKGKRTNWQRDEEVVAACQQALTKYSLPGFDAKYRISPNLEYVPIRLIN